MEHYFFHASPIPYVLSIFNYVLSDVIEKMASFGVSYSAFFTILLLIMTKLINFQRISATYLCIMT